MAEAKRDPEGKAPGVDPLLAKQLEGEGLESQAPGTGAGLVIQKPGETAEDVRKRSEWLLRGEQAADLASYLRLAPKTVLLKKEDISASLKGFNFNLPMQIGDAVVVQHYGDPTYDLGFVDKDGNLAKTTINPLKIAAYWQQPPTLLSFKDDLIRLGFRFFSVRAAEEDFRRLVDVAVAKQAREERGRSDEVRRGGFDF